MNPSMHMPRCWPIGDEHCGHVTRCRVLIGPHLALRLEALPDEHAGPRHPGHLAWPRRDLVAAWQRGDIEENKLARTKIFEDI